MSKLRFDGASVFNIALQVLCVVATSVVSWYRLVSLVCEVGKQIVQCAELLWNSGYTIGGALARVW